MKKLKLEIDELKEALTVQKQGIRAKMESLSKKKAEYTELIRYGNVDKVPMPFASTSKDDDERPNCHAICEFTVKFAISTGPIGRVGEYDGEYNLEVLDNPTDLSESELIKLYPDDDEWDIDLLEEIDCRSRSGWWRESRKIYLCEYVYDYSRYKDFPLDMLPLKFYRWHTADVEDYDIEGFDCQGFSIAIVDAKPPNDCVLHRSYYNTIHISDSKVYLGFLDYTSEAYKKLFECRCTGGDWDLKKFVLATMIFQDSASETIKFYKYTQKYMTLCL